MVKQTVAVGVRCVAAAFGAASMFASVAFSQPLNQSVQELIAQRKLSAGDRVGVSIVRLGKDGTGDRVLADVLASRAFIPASNQKVFSTGAALLVLGPEFTFRTEFQLDGDRLIIKGSGDPSLGDPELLARSPAKLTVPDLLNAIVGSVKKAGVERLSEVVVDDRVFDRQWIHPQWPTRHLGESYGAQVAGVNFHANVLAIFPTPAKQRGAAPSLRLEPDVGFLRIDNLARSVPGEPNTVGAERVSDQNAFRVKGEVGQSGQSAVEVPLNDNATFFGKVLAEHLQKQGVRVERADGAKGEQAVRMVAEGETFENAKTLVVVTTPISDVVKRCNTASMNLYAEALLKRTGHEFAGRNQPGSWENGATALRTLLSQRLGPSFASGTIISDGSGLSEANKVAPATVTRWLSMMAAEPSIGPVYLASMATPGEGSLRTRFGRSGLKNSLQAKTGFVNGVSCLSGYVTHEKSGVRVAFSILCNDVPRGERLNNAIELQREIVKEIDEWVTRQASRVEAAAPEGGR